MKFDVNSIIGLVTLIGMMTCGIWIATGTIGDLKRDIAVLQVQVIGVTQKVDKLQTYFEPRKTVPDVGKP